MAFVFVFVLMGNSVFAIGAEAVFRGRCANVSAVQNVCGCWCLFVLAIVVADPMPSMFRSGVMFCIADAMLRKLAIDIPSVISQHLLGWETELPYGVGPGAFAYQVLASSSASACNVPLGRRRTGEFGCRRRMGCSTRLNRKNSNSDCAVTGLPMCDPAGAWRSLASWGVVWCPLSIGVPIHPALTIRRLASGTGTPGRRRAGVYARRDDESSFLRIQTDTGECTTPELCVARTGVLDYFANLDVPEENMIFTWERGLYHHQSLDDFVTNIATHLGWNQTTTKVWDYITGVPPCAFSAPSGVVANPSAMCFLPHQSLSAP